MAAIVAEFSNPPLDHRISIDEPHVRRQLRQTSAIWLQKMFDEIGKVASFINKLEAIMVKFENVPRLGTFRWDEDT